MCSIFSLASHAVDRPARDLLGDDMHVYLSLNNRTPLLV